MFVCSSTYSRPLDRHDHSLLEEHHAYLRQQYATGKLLCSGPKAPRTGGIIIALGSDETSVRAILDGDPLARAGVAKYQLERFVPSKAAYRELIESGEQPS